MSGPLEARIHGGDDAAWMLQAVELAARGGRAVRPNPQVGCVLVRDGAIVGQGYHARCGAAHAEAAALAVAGDAAKGATAYVTLEPCAHHGRTPPCADALIAAGVARVVIGVADPHGLAAGGAARLRNAGVEVALGVEAAACEAVAEVFLTGVRETRAFLQLKLAATLDGFTAAEDGTSQWITGPAARTEVHRMRAQCDAVLVGSGTALADDPRLDVRRIPSTARPLRVVLDRRLRLGRESHLANTAMAPTLVVVDASATLQTTRATALKARGVEVVCVPAEESPAAWLRAVLVLLRGRGVQHVLCEGGATLAASFMRAGLVDRLDLFQAPLLLGSGRRLWPSLGIDTLAAARRFVFAPSQAVGPDLWVTARPELCHEDRGDA